MNRRDLESSTSQELDFALEATRRMVKPKSRQSRRFKRWEKSLAAVNDAVKVIRDPIFNARDAVSRSEYPDGECDQLLDLAARDLARLCFEESLRLRMLAEQIIERLPERDRAQLRLTTTEEER